MRSALETIKAVKARLAELQKSLPPGVKIVTTYDGSTLIHRAVTNIGEKLIEEFIIVALVCLLFLGHLRSSLVAIITLPLGIVEAVDTAKSTVTIKHQAIASIHWPAMTMTFKADPPSLLKGVKVGEKVNFTLHPDGKDSTVTAITPAK